MNKYLEEIFIHLDGIAMAPIYELITDSKTSQIIGDDLINPSSSAVSTAYTQILCAVLQAQKIVKREGASFKWTEHGKHLRSSEYLFSGVRDYYNSSISLIKEPKSDSKDIQKVLKRFSSNFNNLYSNYLNVLEIEGQLTNSLLAKHLEGALISPILIYLTLHTPLKEALKSDKKIIISKYFKETQSPHFTNSNQICLFLEKIGFIGNDILTDKGHYILSKSHAYGVTDSYMRTFTHLDELVTLADKKDYSLKNWIIWKKDKNDDEYHVNRSLNVWGSGESHKNYFKKIDEYIVEIFNQPIEKQPKGIADMGCGNGAFLYHLNEIITNNTLRGKNLKKYPLFLIGADFNKAALLQTEKTFQDNENIPRTVLADISNPDEYAEKIKKKYLLDISDFLNVRSFLDHNRTFTEKTINKYNFTHKTTNSFAWKNQPLDSDLIQTDLVEHFKKWEKYIYKHGLLVLELHFTNIHKIHNKIGNIPMTAYMATHGFSDQFIIEYDVYKECIKKAGLKVDSNYEATFPNEETQMISINLIS